MIALPPSKILVVDDLEENLIALEAVLRRDGLEFLFARSGREALELLLVHDVALALLDVQMPEMDGFELAELMRGTERTRHVPIIFVTAGLHDRQRVFRGYEVGAVDFLFKPLDPVLVSHKVSTFVELHRGRLELRELLRLNEMFVAAVSHDLRAPLSAVVNGVGILDLTIDDARGKRTLNLLRSSIDRMVGMLDQLYDLSRARLGGGIPLELAEVDFRTLVEKVAGEARLGHPDRGLDVHYEGDDRQMVGLWDATRLGQVLANLLGNALRYGAAGEPVRLNVRARSATLAFDVHNAGEIAPSVRPHLFDAFRSGEERGRERLGLGLYIVRQIIDAHGGTITFTSAPGDGTTFRVELPRDRRGAP